MVKRRSECREEKETRKRGGSALGKRLNVLDRNTKQKKGRGKKNEREDL